MAKVRYEVLRKLRSRATSPAVVTHNPLLLVINTITPHPDLALHRQLAVACLSSTSCVFLESLSLRTTTYGSCEVLPRRGRAADLRSATCVIESHLCSEQLRSTSQSPAPHNHTRPSTKLVDAPSEVTAASRVSLEKSFLALTMAWPKIPTRISVRSLSTSAVANGVTALSAALWNRYGLV